MNGLKAGDKVVVLSGAEKARYVYGLSAFAVDGKIGRLLNIGRLHCDVGFENLAYSIYIPRKFILPIGENTNAAEDGFISKLTARQWSQLVGEIGELGAELTRHFFQSRDRKKEITEEIADVQIMLKQIILHLGIEEEVARWRLNKLERLESRINQAG